jgi:hypothetical protein
MLIRDQARIGKNGNEQAFTSQQPVKLNKIFPEQGLAAGYDAPECPERDCLVRYFADLIQCQFITEGSSISRRKVYIAVPAIVVAAGGDLQIEREGNPVVPDFFPEGKIRKTYERN